MQLSLKLHPNSQCRAVTGIAVEIARPRPSELSLVYRVAGNIGDLRLPLLVAPARTDELWRHTCFEAFVRVPSDAAYYEFNFSPSTAWAAYRFDGYRSGMRIADEVGAPRIATQLGAEQFELHVSLTVEGLIALPSDRPWRLGLSAVIEEADGHKSYWALAHPPGKADFHHSDCFAFELPGS
jgi:hypothetical protein